jgi:Leucine-rich repeat (LRR) protein
MKNALIVVLVLAVGVTGYYAFAKDGSSDRNDKTPSSIVGEEKHVVDNKNAINLSGKGLKEISKDILDNKTITTLDVSDNNLTGALPAEIRKLSNLEVLIASNNKLTGIPAEIGQLNKLRTANFMNNDITGLPLEIGNLSNLETLDLRGNPKISKNDIGLIQPKIPNAKILTD